MNVFLTGSGGFIGSNLAEFLSREYSLVSPRSFELDLTDARAVEKFFAKNEIGAIVHCATVGGVRGVPDPADTIERNLAMFKNLADVSASAGSIPMIVFGSGAQYDKSRPLKRVRECELGEFVPKDSYGLSKFKIALSAQETPNVTCLNIFGCYGKNEKPWRLPSYALLQARAGEKISIGRNAVFDYLYVGDLCKIVAAFLENPPKARVLNVTPDKSSELIEVLRSAMEICGKAVPVETASAGLGLEYTGDNSLLKSELPEMSFTSVADGLRELLSHL